MFSSEQTVINILARDDWLNRIFEVFRLIYNSPEKYVHHKKRRLLSFVPTSYANLLAGMVDRGSLCASFPYP